MINIGNSVCSIPEEVRVLHNIVHHVEDGYYTMHGVFDFKEHHIQRILEHKGTYEIVMSGLYVLLDKESSGWTMQTRY